jgi:hypothetical protein
VKERKDLDVISVFSLHLLHFCFIVSNHRGGEDGFLVDGVVVTLILILHKPEERGVGMREKKLSRWGRVVENEGGLTRSIM